MLNQINAGTTAQVDLKIKPVNKEIFDAGLLSAVSKLNLNGKYMDSTQKDITIKASREVKLEYVDNNTVDNIESTTNIITNKIMKVSGEDKRVVQLEVALGLKENNYPIKEMELQMKIPTIKIQGLKHYIPIYLEQFASYFYVNKINQWQKDKLCTVELIKIA